MPHTHTLEFSLFIDAADPVLAGTPTQTGAFVQGLLFLDATVPDSILNDAGTLTFDLFENAIRGGLVTFDMDGDTGAVDAQMTLGRDDLFVVHGPSQTTIQFDFFEPDGDIPSAGPFDLPVRALGLHLNALTPDPLPSDSLSALLDTGLHPFGAPGHNSNFIVSFDAGFGFFPVANGGIDSLHLHTVPGPGGLLLAGAAAGALLSRRFRKPTPGNHRRFTGAAGSRAPRA